MKSDRALDAAISRKVQELARTERHASDMKSALAAYMEVLDLRIKVVVEILNALPEANGLSAAEKLQFAEANSRDFFRIRCQGSIDPDLSWQISLEKKGADSSEPDLPAPFQ